MSRLPIRIRLTLAFVVAMAVVIAGMGLFVYVRVGDALLSSIDQSLRAQAQEASLNTRDEQGLVDPDLATGRTLVQLLDANGAPVRSSPASLPALLPAADAVRSARGGHILRTISLKRPAGEWRVIAVPAGDTRGAVVVARSLAPREETLRGLLRELLVAGPLALLLASIAGYGLAAAALRPVEIMRRRAAAFTLDSPRSLPVPRSGDELSRLALTLNDMLSRLQAAFEHERRFVADASHELRTPLALLRTELELALRRPRPPEELRDALESALEETERLSRLADDLLLIARSEEGPLPIRPETTSANQLLASVARRFDARAVQGGRLLTVRPSATQVTVDPQRIAQALDNLVDNALTYGEGDVELNAIDCDDGIELHVLDHGAGFPRPFLRRAFDRFSRADHARGRGGAGLGLSIVLLVAEAHGGTAGAENRAEGGADVWIRLPANEAEVRS
jgi:two-component system, OmpR family, sensor kinase